MKKLSDNFELERYGLYARLVREEDVEFIVRLRTNERNARYIHATSANVTDQIEWIRKYKLREERGEDYYFIFYFHEAPVGLIRIYDIDYEKKNVTAGSWVCQPDLPMQVPILILVICREIMFEEIGAELDQFDVRKGNKHVQRVHKMMGAEKVSEDEENYYFELTKNDFQLRKSDVLELLNV